MTADIHPITLTVTLDEDARPAEVNEATTQLYRELLAGNADYVEISRRDAPQEGAMGDPITIGAIVLGLSVAATPGIVEIINNWLGRRRLDTTVKIKLGEDEIVFPAPATASPAELEALAERFVALLKKHSPSQE